MVSGDFLVGSLIHCPAICQNVTQCCQIKGVSTVREFREYRPPNFVLYDPMSRVYIVVNAADMTRRVSLGTAQRAEKTLIPLLLRIT